MFIKELILGMYNLVKKIIVEIDASRIVLGAILSQLDEKNRLYPILFYFKKFTTLELNYNIYDKKISAIVNSFKIWRIYLEKPKYKIKIYIDYKNLRSFISIKVLN